MPRQVFCPGAVKYRIKRKSQLFGLNYNVPKLFFGTVQPGNRRTLRGGISSPANGSSSNSSSNSNSNTNSNTNTNTITVAAATTRITYMKKSKGNSKSQSQSRNKSNHNYKL